MNIVFFAHPDFIAHQSMPRFAKMLSEGMKEKGHTIQVWAPKARTSKLPVPGPLKKWLGYVDQYILFPASIKKKLKHIDSNSLFVFTDHALGPWVPLVANRPHAIHCHDFMAQRSANDEIKEHQTSRTGKIYQKMIRNGYSKGKYFISVSEKTKNDLHQFLEQTPVLSEVVYNGLNQTFTPGDIPKKRSEIGKLMEMDLSEGYLLHVGGNQWYKNRPGIVKIYDAWRENYETRLPLLLIGQEPDKILRSIYSQSKFSKDIHFLTDASDETIRNAYAGASLLLFPSYDEGFGWPIAEAMASGCPVLTTEKPPMTEIAAEAGFYIPKRPFNSKDENWAKVAAATVDKIIGLSNGEYGKVVADGLANAGRFDQKKALDAIEGIYLAVLKKELAE